MRVTDIRAILFTENPEESWSFPHGPGVGAVVTYRFLDEDGLLEENAPRKEDPRVLTESQREVFRDAFEQFEDAANLRFVEVGPGEEAMIGIHNAAKLGNTLGYSEYFPNHDKAPDSMLVVVKHRDGTYRTLDEETVIHELGHAMGLDHPFDGKFKLPNRLDDTDTTVMAYTPGASGPALELRPLDIEALQHLYGTEDSTAKAQVSYEDGKIRMKLSNDADELITPWHDSRVQARGGDDTVYGRQGRDTLIGGAGDDLLNGGGKTDRLFGGAGEDQLVGGKGRDVLTGGSGADQFTFTENDSGARDRITDYALAEDVIDLSDAFTDISVRAVGSDSKVIARGEAGRVTILVENVAAADLEADLGLGLV